MARRTWGLASGPQPLTNTGAEHRPRSATPDARRLSHKEQRAALPDRERSILPIPLRPVTTSLTDLQLAIMRILWDRAEATVVEVQTRLRPERDLAQTTIATLLSRLEKRGVVEHRLDGRQFV